MSSQCAYLRLLAGEDDLWRPAVDARRASLAAAIAAYCKQVMMSAMKPLRATHLLLARVAVVAELPKRVYYSVLRLIEMVARLRRLWKIFGARHMSKLRIHNHILFLPAGGQIAAPPMIMSAPGQCSGAAGQLPDTSLPSEAWCPVSCGSSRAANLAPF